jgi:hypothetical protein
MHRQAGGQEKIRQVIGVLLKQTTDQIIRELRTKAEAMQTV